MRDGLYPWETMPTETDAEFVAMVDMATRCGTISSVWMPRLVEIAKRGVVHPRRRWVWPWQVMDGDVEIVEAQRSVKAS